MERLYINPEILTDGSTAYAVCHVKDGIRVKIACVDQKHALALYAELNKAAWIETEVC